MSIPVRAKERGFYADNLREKDAEFPFEGKEEHLGKWMERLDGKPHPKDKKPVAAAADAKSESDKKDDKK